MKLWRISRTDGTDEYDIYEEAVVAAETEAEAARIHPAGIGDHELYILERWVGLEQVKTELLGEAIAGTPHGVVMASFKAG